MLETIAGRRTYELRIRALLDANEPVSALRLAASAETRDGALSEELRTALNLSWSRLREGAMRQHAAAAARFEGRVLTDEEREYVALVLTELDAQQVPAERPSGPSPLKQGLDAIEAIAAVASQAERLETDFSKAQAKRTQEASWRARAAAAGKLVELLFPRGPRPARQREGKCSKWCPYSLPTCASTTCAQCRPGASISSPSVRIPSLHHTPGPSESFSR